MQKLLAIFSLTTILLLVSTPNFAGPTQTYGPTKATDQLWYIAQKVRPSQEVSKQQTMVALLKANPQAFTANNVNGLRAGYRLSIPSLAQIKAIPATNALIQISEQNAAWLNQVTLNPVAVKNAPESLFTLLGLSAPQELPAWLVNPLAFPLKPTVLISRSPALPAPSNSYLTVAAAQQLIEKDIADHLTQFSQRLDDFLNKIKELGQNTQQKLESVSDEQSTMKNQIASLDKQVQQLRDNYLHISAATLQGSTYNEIGFWILGSSVLLCLLILIYTTSRRRKLSVQLKENGTASLKDTIETIDDEYDYLGSQEGVSAKLDLARAYIDMGNTEQASQVLEDVINHGNEDQRLAARKILADITRDTVH